jgi:hypothetical protein
MNISRPKTTAFRGFRVTSKLMKVGLLAGAAMMLGAHAASADALSTPSMPASLAANPNPISFDAGPLGNIYVSGVASGFADWQSNSFSASPFYSDRDFRYDLSNGQIIVQKTDGLVQFYVQAGEYDILSVGLPTYSSSFMTSNTFSAVPVGYLKLALTDTFSVEAGKLPTLIGDEYTFSFQNLNIERGLLWNQEPAISRGVQANDGYYSNRYNWLSGLATWTINPANTLAFAGGGNIGTTGFTTSNSFATPLLQNNSDIYNLIYTWSSAPWTVSPYVQYSHVSANPTIGILQSADSWGGAVLANYTLNPNWNLAGRVEYISTSGGENLLYGPGSNAWSVTVTPTYQYKVFFARADLSYVTAGSTSPFSTAFGQYGTKTDQFRGVLEVGVVF